MEKCRNRYDTVDGKQHNQDNMHMYMYKPLYPIVANKYAYLLADRSKPGDRVKSRTPRFTVLAFTTTLVQVSSLQEWP